MRTLLLIAMLGWAGIAAAAQADGGAVFAQRCAVCHGANADGGSELARVMNPKPANLRASRLTHEQRSRIVRSGGAAVGRSPNMPAWERELSGDELDAVLRFVGSLSRPALSAATVAGPQ